MGRTGRVRLARGTAEGAGYRPLLLGGFALCAAVVALVLVRRWRRGGPGSEDAAAPPAVSGPAPPGTPGPSEGPSPAETPRPQGGIEERVRARIAEDARTSSLPPPSIGVDDGMAWIDGSVPSPEAREALTDVVGGVEGVNIVVNRAVVRDA